jgi:hypothetical protein
MVAGADDTGVLLALDVNRSVRLVSVPPTGAAQVLLDETTYQKSWAFDPTSVAAVRRSDGVDLLVSDDASVVLVRKQGSSVRVVELANTNLLDLRVLAVAAGASGTLAVGARGDETSGAAQKLTAIDVDPLLAANSTPANLSLATQVAALPAATRSFVGPAGISAAATPTEVWVTTERLDGAADCTPTADTFSCSGGAAAVPWLDCAWHVDAFHLTGQASLQAAATGTVEGRARVHATCGSTDAVGPGAITANVGFGAGMSNHHAVAVDPATSRLALVLVWQAAANAPGLQFGLLDPLGAAPITGVTVGTALAGTSNASFWLATRAGRVFYCIDEHPSTCWNADASAATTFQLDTDSAQAAVQLPGGLGLIAQMNGDPAAWLEPLDCTH